MSSWPWSPAAATGVGSLPGTSAREAAALVTGELADFVHLAELPARGPGSDMVGRTGALLAAIGAFGMETTPDGWRVTDGVGRAMRLADSWLREDLDAFEERTQGYRGPLKVQLVGPWTFAACVELASGERMLRDDGACRDLAQALAEAGRQHVHDVHRRVPGASLLLQWDEPALPSVLAGTIGTASGLSRYRAVESSTAAERLGMVMGALDDDEAISGVHCCAADPPLDLLRGSGARFVSLDLLGAVDDEQLGRAWEGGVGILAGSVPAVGSGRISDAQASRAVRASAERLGLTDERHLANVVVTPSCGLAGASPDWVRTALAACTAAGRVLRNEHLEEAPRG